VGRPVFWKWRPVCRKNRLLALYSLKMALTISFEELVKSKAFKAIPVQAWTGPEGSRRLSFQVSRREVHEGGKVVSPRHRPPLSPRRYPWYSFLLEAESTPGQEDSVKNASDTIGNRTRYLPACSAVLHRRTGKLYIKLHAPLRHVTQYPNCVSSKAKSYQ